MSDMGFDRAMFDGAESRNLRQSLAGFEILIDFAFAVGQWVHTVGTRRCGGGGLWHEGLGPSFWLERRLMDTGNSPMIRSTRSQKMRRPGENAAWPTAF